MGRMIFSVVMCLVCLSLMMLAAPAKGCDAACRAARHAAKAAKHGVLSESYASRAAVQSSAVYVTAAPVRSYSYSVQSYAAPAAVTVRRSWFPFFSTTRVYHSAPSGYSGTWSSSARASRYRWSTGGCPGGNCPTR